MSDVITRWDFHTDILRHPVTGYYVGVYVNDLGGGDWEVKVTDLDIDGTGETVLYSDVVTKYHSNHLRVADEAVIGLEFI